MKFSFLRKVWWLNYRTLAGNRLVVEPQKNIKNRHPVIWPPDIGHQQLKSGEHQILVFGQHLMIWSQTVDLWKKSIFFTHSIFSLQNFTFVHFLGKTTLLYQLSNTLHLHLFQPLGNSCEWCNALMAHLPCHFLWHDAGVVNGAPWCAPWYNGVGQQSWHNFSIFFILFFWKIECHVH